MLRVTAFVRTQTMPCKILVVVAGYAPTALARYAGNVIGFLICGFESIRLRAYGIMMGTLKEVGECVKPRQPPRGRAPIPISLKKVKKS